MENLLREGSKRRYHHPYEPYEIQTQLMGAIYDCIDDKKLGIFESPTGTGKSLSLICASLTWLRDHQEALLNDQLPVEDALGEPAWVVEHSQSLARHAAVEHRTAVEARLQTIRAKELRRKHAYERGESATKRVKKEDFDGGVPLGDDTQFELAEYSSDEEKHHDARKSQQADNGLSSASLHLMDKLGLVPKASDEEDAWIDETKIIFCSRTHSQLTQFVHELQRVDLPQPQWINSEISNTVDHSIQKVTVKHLPLGSRKHLCINPKVSRLGSLQAINERCSELQQSDTPKSDKCAFLPNKENATLVDSFRDHTLAEVHDIEDLASVGQRIGICPYYASRAALKPSEIVTLPYPLLLQKSAREALNLSLKGHIVIIDEAHNLIDTITNINSITVTRTQLRRCRAQLGVYLQKFRNRLKGKNRVYIAQLIRLLDSISGYFDTNVDSKMTAERIVKASDLMAGKGVDQINLSKLCRYLQHSKLARKVEGYVIHEEQKDLKTRPSERSQQNAAQIPTLTHVSSFIDTLTNPVAEGCFFVTQDDNSELCLKYMLLDPTFQFRAVVEEARAVILAGGTMSPMDDYIRHLFAYVDPDRLQTFSCGHIIPKDNLLAMPLSRGVGNIELDFTYEKRSLPAVMNALGESLFSISQRVPDGLVVFFPSYAYLDQVIEFWKSKSIWSRLQAMKPIFQEAKGAASVDDTLSSYSEAIAKQKGGLLLSVIGGKLSEGINFSDALGRCVVVVGLPFPNIHSAQWKAKLEYIEQSVATRTGRREEGKAAARAFVENACMRAVNQSIGRAIRHKGDYASIILLDKRYSSERIQGKLPAWIRQGLIAESGLEFPRIEAHLGNFFKSKEKSVD